MLDAFTPVMPDVTMVGRARRGSCTLHELTDRAAMDAMSALSPGNPFHTEAFLRASDALGAKARVVMFEKGGGGLSCAAPALVRRGRLRTILELPSAPDVDADHPFWAALIELCREERVSVLRVQTFASGAVGVPTLGRERSRRPRREFALSLAQPLPARPASSHHARKVRSAVTQSVRVRVVPDAEREHAIATHVQLGRASMDRRAQRGENVDVSTQERLVRAMLAHGAGQLHQAERDGVILSSMLVLRSARGGYYHSAGTSPDGMTCGASHLLVWETARLLRENGATVFHLGGADAGEAAAGLRRFKAGFGASERELVATEHVVGKFWVAGALELARRTGLTRA
jgi:hypothetical protein